MIRKSLFNKYVVTYYFRKKLKATIGHTELKLTLTLISAF